MEAVTVVLPYPNRLSVNAVWKRSAKGVYLSPHVKQYRKEVYYLCLGKHQFGDKPVRVEIKMFPPDKRMRDLDNLFKVVLDALQYADVFDNDSQIVQLYIEKKEIKKGGCLEILITSPV